MLTKCPECDLQVSDKAMICPHCGYPLTSQAKSVPRKSNKRRRLPNGFGQISEIKNRNLRKPYRCMITIGKTEYGRPICKLLKPNAYFATYNEAYEALMEYNKSPNGMGSDMTLKELYEKWSSDYYRGLDRSTMKNHEVSWNYCSSLHNVRVVDIRPSHIRDCMETGTIINSKNGMVQEAGPQRQLHIKSLFNLLLDYAVQYGVVDRNYAREFKIPRSIQQDITKDKKSHIAFTEEELEILWAHREEIPFINIILIQCYSGWRPNELCTLKLDDVDIYNWLFTGGSKTEAGKNRPVPIHSKIRDLVKSQYNTAKSNNMDYLISYVNSRGETIHLRYIRYNLIFQNIMNHLRLNQEHRPHDCRNTFITLAKKYNVDEYAIKYIVGHSITDITEKVYTERDVDWLKTEIEKIK